jgi:hypothetical protein
MFFAAALALQASSGLPCNVGVAYRYDHLVVPPRRGAVSLET